MASPFPGGPHPAGHLPQRSPANKADDGARRLHSPLRLPSASRKTFAVKKRPAPAPPATLPPPLRGYLYFTAAVTGAAIMIIEILGAKMLSPYIGLSHFVWTAQIADRVGKPPWAKGRQSSGRRSFTCPSSQSRS